VRLLRFRSLEECDQAESALGDLPGLTTLPGGVLAVPDERFEAATACLDRAGIDWRWEPLEGGLQPGGRVFDEVGPPED
jgi:hypothetical protein